MRTISTVPKTAVRERAPSRRWERTAPSCGRYKASPTSPLPRCCKWDWRSSRCTSRPLTSCWHSIWWRGSSRAPGDANQDWSRANSIAAGVGSEEGELAVVIFLRYYHRKNNATPPYLHEPNPATGTTCPPAPPLSALPRAQTGPGAVGVLLQRHRAEADDEVRQSPLRLRLRPHQASTAILRPHLQN